MPVVRVRFQSLARLGCALAMCPRLVLYLEFLFSSCALCTPPDTVAVSFICRTRETATVYEAALAGTWREPARLWWIAVGQTHMQSCVLHAVRAPTAAAAAARQAHRIGGRPTEQSIARALSLPLDPRDRAVPPYCPITQPFGIKKEEHLNQ
jgi:hypothetical protein